MNLSKAEKIRIDGAFREYTDFGLVFEPPADLLFRKKCLLSVYPRLLEHLPEWPAESVLGGLIRVVAYPADTFSLFAENETLQQGFATWLLDYFTVVKLKEIDQMLTKSAEDDQMETVLIDLDGPTWKSFMALCPPVYDDSEWPDYAMGEDVVHHPSLISGAISMLRHRSESRRADFEKVIALIDEETKNKLIAQYDETVFSTLLRLVRLSARDQEKITQTRLRLESIKRELAGLNAGAPFAGRPETHHEHAVEQLRQNLEYLNRLTACGEFDSYVEANDMFAQWDQAYIRREYGSRVAAEMQMLTIEEPYELLAGAMLAQSAGHTAAGLAAAVMVVLSQTAALLPWSVDEVFNVTRIVSKGKPSFARHLYLDLDYAPRVLGEDEAKEDESDLLEEDDAAARIKAITPGDLWRINYPQLVYLVSGMVLPRRHTLSEDIIRFAKLSGATDIEAHEIAAMSLIGHCLGFQIGDENEDRQVSTDADKPPLKATPLKPASAANKDKVPETKAETTDEKTTLLQEEIASLKKTVAQLREALYQSRRTIRDQERRFDTFKASAELDRQELISLRELAFSLEDSAGGEEIIADDPSIEFPYEVTSRIVVFGGHESWKKTIRPFLPNVRFFDRHAALTNVIRSADLVFIQPNAISHSLFHALSAAVRAEGRDFHYLKYASARKCAEQIVKVDQRQAGLF